MATLNDGYVARIAEVTYGTPLPPTGFDEFLSESVTGKYEVIESAGLRAGNSFLRTDRFTPNAKGAAGDLKLEVLDNNFDFWMKYMFGAATTVTKVTTATIGTTNGASFTLECGRPGTNPTGTPTIYPFRYGGGKISSWELSNAVDGTLQANLSCDFASEITAALSPATPTYPVGSQLLTFVGATATIGGTAVAITDLSIKGDNGLNVGRYALRGANSTTKREPLNEGLRSVTFDLKMEFEDLTQYNRTAAVTAAGSMAAIVATWTSPQGGSLAVTLPQARFDDGIPNMDKQGVLDLGLTGSAMWDGTVSPITAVYTSKP